MKLYNPTDADLVAGLCAAIRKVGYEPISAYKDDGSWFIDLIPVRRRNGDEESPTASAE